ncbi:uncharacterized protein [Asterias amurensis]|uniref:uncharacterized protein n=1 Tax=Asterias amurensis TaxID=7602 RepID=UPI003AB145E9
MSTTTKFFTSGSPSAWDKALGLYGEVIKLKASNIKKPGGKKDLLDLDKWYQEDLPKLIQGREPKYITHEEITKLMKWKLTRGKFRPRLNEMVQENKPDLVESASKKAFKSLPNLEKAIKEMTVLRAVGPATASAILAAGAPEHAPFMADESMLPIPGLAPLKYTPVQYAQYSAEVKACITRLQKEDSTAEWTPHKVEIALWTHYMSSKLQPSLLAQLDDGEKRKASDDEDQKGAKRSKRSDTK